MIALRTRYVGPVNLTGARIKVTGEQGQRLMPYDHGAQDAHVAAVQAYCARVLRWEAVSATEYMSSDDGQRRAYRVTDQSRAACMSRHPSARKR
jgi:hypothetical protein